MNAGQKSIRGGGFNFNENDTFAATRQRAGTTFRGTDVGVRCARSPL